MSRIVVSEFVNGVMDTPSKTAPKLVDTKTFDSGVVVHTYRPAAA